MGSDTGGHPSPGLGLVLSFLYLMSTSLILGLVTGLLISYLVKRTRDPTLTAHQVKLRSNFITSYMMNNHTR